MKKINFLRILKLENWQKPLIYLLIFLIFFTANFAISFFSLRLDFSYGKAYSLSPSTKKIIKNLEDVLNIKFFVSSDLPTRLLPLRSQALDFLNEYQKEGRGKIILKVLDPKKDQEALNQAQEAGLPQLQFSQLEQNRYQVAAVYFGIVLSYGTKQEIIPQITDLGSLEYNLTALIYKMSKKEFEKIAVLGRKEELNSQEDSLLSFKQVLRQQFQLDFVDLTSNKINKEYKAVVVFDNNQKEYSNEEVTSIKNYIKDGGKAIFFVDGVWVLDNLQTEEAKHNLFSLLSDFGVNLEKNLVLSTSAELVNFGNQMFQFITPYPFWIKTDIFAKDQSHFSNISQLLYPWSSAIDLKDNKKTKNKVLVFSSKSSWQQKDNFVLDPQNIPQPKTSDLKQFPLTVYIKDNNNGGELVVIPSSRFVLERYLSRTADNLEFVLNLLNNLAASGALSGIRQRAVSFYPLPPLSDSQKDLFRYLNIFSLPSFFALFGLIRLLKRAKD